MNTVQLTAIMDRISENTHFLGVLACDQLPERPIQKLPSSVIINTHSSDFPGKHWLAVYITKDRIGCVEISKRTCTGDCVIPKSAILSWKYQTKIGIDDCVISIGQLF